MENCCVPGGVEAASSPPMRSLKGLSFAWVGRSSGTATFIDTAGDNYEHFEVYLPRSAWKGVTPLSESEVGTPVVFEAVSSEPAFSRFRAL